MKHIYILRHADKNKETGQLTDTGRERAKNLKKSLGFFDLVITSDRPRTVETVILLTNQNPLIDERAGFTYNSDEEKNKLHELAKDHPLSHAGAIFDDIDTFGNLAHYVGEKFIDLLQETFKKLPENGQALIVSQDGVMVAAEQLLLHKPFQKQERYFEPLGGFIVDEGLQVAPLD